MYIDRAAVISQTRISRAEYEHVMRVLDRRMGIGIVKVDDGDFARDFTVLHGIADVVGELDAPPAKDYWQDVTTWFRSKPWSVGLILLGIAVPFGVGCVTMARFVLELLGIVGGK